MAALRGDTRLEAKLPADGEYRLQFHDLQYAAAAPSHFRLKIGHWSYADLAFPSDGSARSHDRGPTRRPRG